ncbi:MAG: valine--tRNA ligase, partial [Actinomycetota bacterium]|nr:valine--tRNA ligase [Actinomycetota bacterium]
MSTIPDKPSLDGLEATWAQRWETDGTYTFDRDAAATADRSAIFAIDTPPPTVSGSLHMGTIFGYTQTDAIVRFQRMRGRAVFYPIGWDDNGLATERRVQNFYGVRCDPSQPYDPAFQPPAEPPEQAIPISRPNFVDLCQQLTAEDEQVFEDIFRRLGLSVDWSLMYTTVGEVSRRTSQLAFLSNLERGEAYSAEAPTLWDIDDRTAVAQAELEDRERPGAYHLLAFHRCDDDANEGDVLVDTTRPELVPSCVALVAHPGDERYHSLVGQTVETPLFGVEVPVVAHPLAEPDKGTGLAMICTFGDTTDVTWWRELQLPTRALIGRDGRFASVTPDWITSDIGKAAYAELAGTTVKQAQRAIVGLLGASGEMHGDPRPLKHPVKFYERGTRPLEIVTSRQWYISNGGRAEALRKTFLERGRELVWHPPHMRHRYEDWVGGLNGDWLISRQRFFGVPIPLWYPLDADGRPDHETPIVPDVSTLPIDPSSDAPPGYHADQRGRPDGFVGDSDVMDTWATSSLTPQIAGRWADDPETYARLFPMDLRPQGPEIIRTWLFATLVRSHYEHDAVPWAHTAINGWILDPERKKMSKSKGNVITPVGLFDTYGTDAVRYWAASGRPGVDTAFSEEQMKVGRRLAIKLLNVTRFVLGLTGLDANTDGDAGAVEDAVDRAMLAKLDTVVAEATGSFDDFDYARALERTEAFFWWFCDDYVELVKGRAYGGRGEVGASSARAALRLALDVQARLLAPILPFAAEESWSWSHDTSVHRAQWPTLSGLGGQADLLDPAIE